MASPLFKSTITNDCKTIVVHPPSLQQAGAVPTIEITNGASTSGVLPVTQDQSVIIIPTHNIGTDKGVFHVKYYEDGKLIMQKGVVATCDILCCLSKKVDKLLDCSADCSKCASELAEAQKIFLLLKSAETEVAGTGVTEANIVNATNKYDKAAEICGGHCGCDC
tara:strand:+ start:13439 stop:13933 length:495 start_codon:yes stop_codon:yes gene_type:complete